MNKMEDRMIHLSQEITLFFANVAKTSLEYIQRDLFQLLLGYLNSVYQSIKRQCSQLCYFHQVKVLKEMIQEIECYKKLINRDRYVQTLTEWLKVKN